MDRIDVIDPAGKQLHYVYNAAGNLIQFYNRTNPVASGQPTMSYDYLSGTHFLQDLFDARGIQAARNYYDDQGRLYKTVDAEGKATVFTHDIAGRTETITDRAGNVTVNQYDERGNIVYVKAADGTVTQTSYHHWSNGTLSDLKEVESVSGLFSDGTGKLSQQTLTTRYAYEDPNGPPHDDGLLRSITDPLGHVTSMSYDGMGNVLTVTDARSNANGGGPTTLNTYYPNTNLVQTSTDANGNVTNYAYDGNGNPFTVTRTVTVVDAGGNTHLQTVSVRLTHLEAATWSVRTWAHARDETQKARRQSPASERCGGGGDPGAVF